MNLSDFSTFHDVPHITVNLPPFKEIHTCVSELTVKVKDFYMTALQTKSKSADFRWLTVDPRTAHRNLQLSEGNRTITFDDASTHCHREPERFNCYTQALCREALQECCYWEVEWRGQQVHITAPYRGVERIGCCSNVAFGHNDKSWSLCCNSSQFSFFHNERKTVNSGPLSTRIGIYLDHRAGSLSFYSITDTMTLLLRVCTTFTETLHAGFWTFDGSSVKLCEKTETVRPQTCPTAANKLSYRLQFELNFSLCFNSTRPRYPKML